VSSDREFDRIDDVGVGALTEQEDVFSRRGGVVRVVEVAFLGSDGNVTARKAPKPIAVATFSEVEGHGSLSVGPSPSRDAEAEGRSEGLTSGSRSLEEPRTDVTRVDGLAEVHVDISDLVSLEKGQDALSRVVGSRRRW
jgi:hypothetical protein